MTDASNNRFYREKGTRTMELSDARKEIAEEIARTIESEKRPVALAALDIAVSIATSLERIATAIDFSRGPDGEINVAVKS